MGQVVGEHAGEASHKKVRNLPQAPASCTQDPDARLHKRLTSPTNSLAVKHAARCRCPSPVLPSCSICLTKSEPPTVPIVTIYRT